MLGAGEAQGQLLDGADWFEREVGDGVVWRYYQFDTLFGAKQSVSYMEVELDNPNVGLTIPYREGVNVQNPAIFPRALTSVMAATVPNAKAAVNGTYFNTRSYDPDNPTAIWGGGTSYLKVNGNVIQTFDGTNPNNHGYAIQFDNTSNVTMARRPGGGWATVSAGWSNLMVCGPPLLVDGVVEAYAPTNDHANLRHPRTAVGLSADGDTLYLVTVDGRTAEAAGMSCTELAQTLAALGAHNAINLDGGGSTTLWTPGEPHSGIVNYPSDNGVYDHLGQRGGANALVVSSTAPVTAAWDGRLVSFAYDALSRSEVEMTATAVITNIGTETWTPANVTIAPSRPSGRVSDFIPSGNETTFALLSPTSVAPGQNATFTLTLTPPSVANDQLRTENFALVHTTNGRFGPADNEMRLRTTVRPPLAGAPSAMIIQGKPTGPNNQWYFEEVGNWANSTVSFDAALGVDTTGGVQRYVSATSTNRRVSFKPVFEVAGIYSVEAAFPHSSNNITAVTYTVFDANGSQSFVLNQNNAAIANSWQMLGEFEFGTGTVTTKAGEKAVHGVHHVDVSNLGVTGNRFYSGAIRVDFVAYLPGVEAWMYY
jgi:hypothetical protein